MDSKLKVYDNFLSKQDFQNLRNQLLGYGNFPWYLDVVVPKHYDIDEMSQKYNFQFCHYFHIDYQTKVSDNYSVILPLLNQINPFALLRVKANLNPRTEKIIEGGYHTDYHEDTECLTSVFYVNTTNGYTKFKTGEVVEGIENRLVVFDARTEHTGTTCTDSDVRCVININYIPWPEKAQ